MDRVADRHESQIELDPGYLLAVDLLDVVDLQRGGDDDASVALPDEVDTAAQTLGEVDGPAVALRGGEGQAGRHSAAQHLPDAGRRGHQGDAVVGVVEAVAAGHAGQLAQDADHLGVHLTGRGCDVGLLLRQGTRRDEQGGHVLAVGAHRARAVADPGLRAPLVVLLAEDHGLIDSGA